MSCCRLISLKRIVLHQRILMMVTYCFSKLLILALVFVLITPPDVCVRTERVVCSFWSSESSSRVGEYTFHIQNIPAGLCTHVAFYSIAIDFRSKELLIEKPEHGDAVSDWQKFLDLKRVNPQIKLLITIQTPLVMRVAAVEQHRKKLIKSIVGYVETLNLDGVEIFWRGDFDSGYFLLIEELKSHLVEAGRSACEVTVLVEIDKKTTEHERLCRLADFVHVIGTRERRPEYHGPDQKPIANALYAVAGVQNLTLERALQHWIDSKCPANKLTLVTVFMAQGFRLVDENETGEVHELTELSFLRNGSSYCGYIEFCQILKNSEWSIGWDDAEGLAPHATQGDRWVSFENVASIERKGEISRAMGLAGVYGAALETDDYLGKCGTVYPLIKALRRSFLQTKA
uniref:GH18 domain-containing protein n=1 Tax=Anopheles farauti TaxID=69004 RepID=A0A182QAE1_9DIPT